MNWKDKITVDENGNKVVGSTVSSKRVFTPVGKASDSIPDYNDLPELEVIPPREHPEKFVEDMGKKLMTKEEILQQYPLTEKEVFKLEEKVDLGKRYQHDSEALRIIEAFRKGKGISRAKVAEALDITETGYYNIERGKTRVSWMALYKICRFLEIKITINGQEI